MNPRGSASEAALAALTFTEEDSRANRGGELTPSQRAMLEGYAHDAQRWGTISTIGVLVLTVVPAGYGLITETRAEERRGAGFFLLLVAAVASFAWFYTTRANRRLRNGKPAVARGAATKKTGTSDGGQYYTLHVGGQAFHLAGLVFDAFTEGNLYRVYYVAHVNHSIILSFELDEPADGTTAHAFRARYRA